MKIKLIESLSIDENLLKSYKEKLENQGHEFTYYLDKAGSIEEQKERIKGADIVMIANSPLSGQAFEDEKNLKLINVAFTGYDHVDLNKANEMGIKVCNASGYSNISVAELVIGLTLNIYRKISEGDSSVRQGKTHSDYYKGLEIKDKTVGIIGTGNIGLETARLFKAFGAKLIGYSRSKRESAKELGLKYMSKEEVFKNSDIISIHLSLNDKTRAFVNGKLLSLMKKDSILINCSRGPVLDNQALSEMLNDEKIAYAAIDVFDMEPPIPSDYPILRSKNTLLSPHIAYLTEESMVRRAEIAFQNTLDFIEGNPRNLVN